MPRVLIPRIPARQQGLALTDPGQLHHLLHVLRVGVGDELDCFDGLGHRCSGRITRCSQDEILMQISERSTEPRPTVRTVLIQALIKPERFEWVIQKATELDIAEIVPVVTAHTVIRPSAATAQRRVSRWHRIAVQAAQQCGRATLPAIRAPQPFEQILPVLAAHHRVLMPTLATPAPMLPGVMWALRGTTSVAVLIGPEGDFTGEEVARAQRAGARVVSLGPLTLRAETAAIATLAALRYADGAG